MSINLQKPDITELKPRITVFGVGGGGGNAVNNMISSGLDGVEFVVANTDAQALSMSQAERIVQMGVQVTEGLGAGSQPEIGAAAARECIDEITDHLAGTHMAFVTAGMGGGTGTGAAPVIAAAAREAGILTVGVVTKPFSFEGKRRMKLAEEGIAELQANVDTLIVIPNQNLFHVATEKTTFAEAFAMADQVLYSGVACITDLMTKEGLINLDFADVRSVTRDMGRAMMGTGEASGENRALAAAEAAITNPLLDETSMSGAMGLLISITGGRDITLFEVDQAATRISEEVSEDANIIVGATHDDALEGVIRVSVVATSIDMANNAARPQDAQRLQEAADRMRAQSSKTYESAKPEVTIQRAPSLAATPAVEKTAPAAAKSEEELTDDIFAKAFEQNLAAETGAAPQTTAQPVAAKMPTAEDFPPNMRPAAAGASENQQAGGLLQRLKSSFASPASEDESEKALRSAEPVAPPAPPVHQAAAPVQQTPPQQSMYAPSQPREGLLDVQGRTAPAANRPLSEDEQLDIPAFLRRSAS